MARRTGRWDLLDHSEDPINADLDEFGTLLAKYRATAQLIMDQTTTLKAVADGTSTVLVGQSIDTLKDSAKEVADGLGKTQGRYDAVIKALDAYSPNLQAALTDSAKALSDAEAAGGSLASAQGMPDPSANRAADAPPLTDDEQAAVDQRTAKVNASNDQLDAAKADLRRVLDALDDAAGTAAKTIDDVIWSDEVYDSPQYQLDKVLKLIAAIFAIIGAILAVIALFVTGIGAVIAAIAGAVVAVVSLGITAKLFADGQVSVGDLVIAIVGLVTLGVGAAVTAIVKSGSKIGGLLTRFSLAIAKGGKNGRGFLGGVEMTPMEMIAPQIVKIPPTKNWAQLLQGGDFSGAFVSWAKNAGGVSDFFAFWENLPALVKFGSLGSIIKGGTIATGALTFIGPAFGLITGLYGLKGVADDPPRIPDPLSFLSFLK